MIAAGTGDGLPTSETVADDISTGGESGMSVLIEFVPFVPNEFVSV